MDLEQVSRFRGGEKGLLSLVSVALGKERRGDLGGRYKLQRFSYLVN